MLMVILGLFTSILFGLGVSLKILSKENVIEIIATTVGFGFGLPGLIIFIENQMLGIEYSIYNSVFLSLIMLLIGIYLIITNKTISIFQKILNEDYKIKNYKVGFFFLIILISFYLAVLYKSAFFPSSEWDGIYYHLYIDKWVFVHKTLPMDVGPSNLEYINAYPMLSTWYGEYLMELNGGWDDIIYRLFSPIFSILIAFIIFLFTLRMGGKVEAALLSVLFFISSPIVCYHSISTYIEMCFVFYVLLGLYFLFRYETQNEFHYLILSGLFFGFSALTKYNGIAVITSIVIYIFIKIIIGKIWTKDKVLTLNQIGILIFSFLFISAPIYIRNYLFFGDPLYPFLNGIFPGKNLNPFLMEATVGSEFSPNFYIYKFIDVFFEYPQAINGVLIAILIITLIDWRFWKKKDLSIAGLFIAILTFLLVSNPYYYGEIYYYFISIYGIFSIFAALWVMEEFTISKIKKKQMFFIAILTCINIIVLGNYFFHNLSIRRLIESFSELISIFLFLTFIIFKYQYFNFINKIRPASVERWSKAILILAVVSMLIASGATIYKIRGKSFIPIPHDESIRNIMGDFYDLGLWINRNTPENAKILSFEERRYYLEREILPANSYRVEQIYQVKNLKDAISVLHHQEAEYILDSPQFRNRKLFNKSPIFINLNNTRYFKLIYNKGEYSFYKIK